MQRRFFHITNSHHSEKRQINKISNGLENNKQSDSKNKYQMHNIDCLMDNIAQKITQSSDEGEVLFSTIELRYAYSQIPLDEETAKQCNFNINGGQTTGTYRFNNGF